MTGRPVEIDVSDLFGGQAKLAEIDKYEAAVSAVAGEGQDVILTGAGPVWLYLRLAHALHGKVRRLSYRSPVTGDVLVFDHNPFDEND